MEYTQRRILGKTLAEVGKYIYSGIVELDGFETKAERYLEPLKYEVIEEWRPIEKGDTWFCPDGVTRRFRFRAAVPEHFKGKTVVMVLDVGGEGLVRIDGEIVTGITSYLSQSWLAERMRTRVYLPERAMEKGFADVEVEVCLNFMEFMSARAQGATGQIYTLKTAYLAVLNERAEDYYFDLSCAAEAMDTFENPMGAVATGNAQRNDLMKKWIASTNENDYLYKKVLSAILASINALDTGFDEARIMASLPAAKMALAEGLKDIPYKAHAKVKWLGQAHIDTAWLWPLKETVRKCGKTFANQLALMRRYPESIFSFSQPQLFAYVEEFYPELFEEIKARVADGHIELVGNAWVEMDTNVPSGESLVRQLLYGRQYYLEKFGVESKVFWMPDVFGYTYALPQIMKRSGVQYFFTSKLVNNDTNRFPHSLFMWQGVDGTKILSYLQRLNYNGDLRPGTLSSIYDLFDQKDACDEILMTIGYGDGGGGPSYQMLENAKRLKHFPGLPEAEFATAQSFFEHAEGAQEDLPVWNDEMYYEFHRGTYTSQADTKKNNRKSELFLRKTEIACSLASVLYGKPYPAREIGDLYKRVLTNQFHDILPGSSINEVYEDAKKCYAEVFEKASAIYVDAMATLNDGIGCPEGHAVVWNFLSHPRTGVVCADGVEFLAEDIPAMGYKVVKVEGAKSGAEQNTLVLENEFLRVALDGNGNIESLYDKAVKREVLSKEAPSNLLTIFADSPAVESAWNIDLEYQNKCWELISADSVQWVENSDVKQVIRVVRSFNESKIEQDIVLHKHKKQVDFETRVHWQETERMLKAAFYPNLLSGKATYEIQYGAIERPTHWNTSYDKARFEVCGHKWADLSEGNYGASILNDCKYGYDIKDNRMRLTLLRSPNYPDPVADKGTHTFTYAFYPHEGSWRCAKTVQMAYELNVPLEAFPGSGRAGEGEKGYFSVDQDFAVIEAVKGAEDGQGLILRVYECNGSRGKVVVSFGIPVKAVKECDLMEREEGAVPIEGNGFAFELKPHEIKTFRLM